MKKIFLIFLFFQVPYLFHGQENKRDNIWMMGSSPATFPKAGIDFNSGSADTFSIFRSTVFFLTNASICDTNGQLLFYTNGNFVVNHTHNLMPDSVGFNPGDENTNTYPYGSGLNQGAMILPWPNRFDKYIILHLSANNFAIGLNSYTRPLSLRYSVIDMTLDSAYGNFTNQKNIILVQDTLVSGRIMACRHANGRDWWIISHELWSNMFYEFLLTPDTVHLFQTQHIGSTITHRMDLLGAGVFSRDGERFAYLNSDTTLNIFDFDRCTGNLSNPVYVYFLDTLNLGTTNCAFSASGRYLYVCNNFHIFQLDMQATDIAASKTIVATYDGFTQAQQFRTIFALMKLAPDNKIYVSTYEGTEFLHVINSPDSAGINCNVTQHSFTLPDYNNFSMPNVPNYALGALTGSVCDSLNSGIPYVQEINSLFIIYPNPSSGKINIRFNENISYSKSEFQIFNLLGEEVYSRVINRKEDLMDIDIHSLSDGIYSCHLILNNVEEVSGKLSVIH
jgi:hypothetical protein